MKTIVKNEMTDEMTSLVNIQDCQRTYSFDPELPWPDQLPAFCYKNELLCAFERREGVAIALQGNLPDLIHSLYPNLSFIELARLTKQTKLNQDQQKELWAHYGFRWKENLTEIMERLVQLPQEAQAWLQSKKMNPQDLAPLRSLPLDMTALLNYWPHFLNSGLSKTDGAKALEFLIELILMETPSDQLYPSSPGPHWLRQLQTLRYPKSTNQDSTADTKIRSIAWPLRSEAKWSRRGDRSGVELKLFFSHPQELKRSLERLEQVCTDLSELKDYEDLWSKN